MTSTKPLNQFRYGALKATLWTRGYGASARYEVTFSRLIGSGSQAQESMSFTRDDLLLLAKLADRVHTALLESGL